MENSRDGSKTAQALRTDAQDAKPAAGETVIVEGYSRAQVDELIAGAVASGRHTPAP